MDQKFLEKQLSGPKQVAREYFQDFKTKAEMSVHIESVGGWQVTEVRLG